MFKHPKIDGQRSSSVDFRAIRKTFKSHGITRVADITGLDTIGVPVTTVCRPNSPTLSINSGKGLTFDQALHSGIMEAMEFSISEKWRSPDAVYTSHRQLGGSAIPADLIAYSKNSIFRDDLAFQWEPMKQMDGSGYEVFVPSSQVGMAVQTEGYDSLMAFQIGTNGIASGGNTADAMLSGIYEVIERDAWTIGWLRAINGWPSNLVKLETVPGGPLRDLIDKLDRAGVDLFVTDVTLDTAPVYGAYITDRNDKGVGVFLGYGCHLDPETAMIRAITEACQGRACYIAGARDDLFRRNFEVLKKQVDAGKKLRAIEATEDFAERENEASDFVDQDIANLMAKLAIAGHVVLSRDLTSSDDPVSVVRIIIPGFEGHNFDYYAPGKRAIEHLKKND